MTDTLRERVARLVCSWDGGRICSAMCATCCNTADAAIALVLEEAAKCAEGYERVVSIQEPTAKWLIMPDGSKVELHASKIVDRTGCDDIAAAIRALKDA